MNKKSFWKNDFLLLVVLVFLTGTSHAGFFKKVGNFFTKSVPGFFSCRDLVIRCRGGNVTTPTWMDKQSKTCTPRDSLGSAERFIKAMQECVFQKGGFLYGGNEQNPNNFRMSNVPALVATNAVAEAVEVAMAVAKFVYA